MRLSCRNEGTPSQSDDGLLRSGRNLCEGQGNLDVSLPGSRFSRKYPGVPLACVTGCRGSQRLFLESALCVSYLHTPRDYRRYKRRVLHSLQGCERKGDLSHFLRIAIEQVPQHPGRTGPSVHQTTGQTRAQDLFVLYGMANVTETRAGKPL